MLAKTFLFVEEVLVIINVLTGLVLVHTNILSSPFSLSTACKQLQLQPELRHTGDLMPLTAHNDSELRSQQPGFLLLSKYNFTVDSFT